MGFQLNAMNDSDLERYEKVVALLKQIQNGPKKMATAEQIASEVLRRNPRLKMAGMPWSVWVQYIGQILEQSGLFNRDAAMSISDARREQVVDILLSLDQPPTKAPTPEQARHQQIVDGVLETDASYRQNRHDPTESLTALLTPDEIKDLAALLERGGRIRRNDKRATAKAIIAMIKQHVESEEARR